MNDGQPFESYVQWVYDALLNMDLEQEKVIVARRVQMKGVRSGRFRNIDVFYSFERVGVPHRVAIECKDRGRPISMDDVGAFVQKLDDIGGLQGLIISRSGFQEGAFELARTHSVLAIGPSEFPNLQEMVATFLRALLPDETVLGAPFYAIMEDGGDGSVTGSYFAEIGPLGRTIPLFPSRAQAERYMSARSGNGNVVRGVTQRHLIVLLRQATLHGKNKPLCSFIVALQPDEEAEAFAAFPYRISSLFRDFVRVPVSREVYDPEGSPF
ncbi:MAG TPA: restriction endonuclease [Candidatus Baltobacteraceae bacterium]|nr:restriction endonuclease [Candidatus Baltobacteraceae bacterium]